MNQMIFFVFTVEDPKADKANEWFTHLKTNGTEIQYKLDTGSQVNIITEQLFNKLRKKLKSTNQKSNLHPTVGTPYPSKEHVC